jgi:hypothetical protein
MALKELLSELEREIQLKKIEYNSYINQPQLITVSSDATTVKSYNVNNDSYYTFTCSLDRPAIGAKSLQLLSANIPQAKGISFSDTELIFFYYRIRTQENVAGYTIFNEAPSMNNLFYVRLLPSYYPSNIIPDAQTYGFNKTFNNYQELSDELAKSCSADLRYTNESNVHFVPNDVLISYNETENKFQLKGNNINANLIAGYPPIWNSNTTYYKNNIVYHTPGGVGQFYIATATTFNVLPSTLNGWALYVSAAQASTKIWNTYLVAGYEDPNVLTLQKNLHYDIEATDYNINTTYSLGAVVYFNNAIYESLINNNTNNNPITSPNAWRFYVVEETNADFFYGRYGLPNIVDIQRQPFRQGKTLAKRMGFTWNGTYNWDSGNPTDPLYYNATTSGSGALLWNRLRPIPFYEILPPDVEVEDPVAIPNNNPFEATTYIAEAFCNLVYSSIISIYSDITTASTIDTQSKRNILAMIPVNCGQLGITFTNNFIENQLTKINSDVYQIRIELRDEIGEPYYISNNGVVTLTLKLTY